MLFNIFFTVVWIIKYVSGILVFGFIFSRYEPEIFPALIYRIIKPRLVMLIFVNGKIVMTGK